MKSRHFLWMALCLYGALSAMDSFAQRVKPTLPEPDTIRAGKYYYLWNEEAGFFLETDESYMKTSTTPETTYKLDETSSGIYTISYPKYLWASGVELRANQDGIDNDAYFRINRIEGNLHTIQRNRNYNATQYIGYSTGETRIYTDKTTNIKWRLIPANREAIEYVGTNAASWNTNGSMVSIDGVSMPEKYEGSTTTLGDVMWQTVTGLENGTYTVELYANARYTPDRGFETTATDGQMNCTYLFANDVELSIPVVFNAELADGQSYTLENVEVTDGTLKMGMTKKAAGSNWHTIQIKALTPHTPYSYDNNIAVARMGLYLELEKLGDGFYTGTYDELLRTSNDQRELIDAAKEVRSAKDFADLYTPKSYSYPLLFINDSEYPWSLYYYNNGFCSYRSDKQGYTSRMKAIVEVLDDEATLVYTIYSSDSHVFNIYIDGNQVRNIPLHQITEERKYYEILGKGVHTIEWECIDRTDIAYDDVRITDIYVEPTPTISVSLLEPGSLGTEVLAQVNNIKEVLRLKVKGEMNSEDWANILLMPNLYSADLSEAIITEIPDGQFQEHNSGMWNFHKIVLPEGLTRIGTSAFCDTEVEEVNFPSTLTEIAGSAFQSTLLKKALMPETVTGIGEYAFYGCRSLAEISYPSERTYIPASCFWDCYHLQAFDLPENLKTIGDYAFCNTWNCKIDAQFPESLETIGSNSFYAAAIDTLIIPEGVSIGTGAFKYCNSLKYVELPTTYNKATTYELFSMCNNLRTIRLKSPTVADYSSNFITDSYRANITLQVPDYLVSAYKLHTYWYNYGNIEGFATSEIDTWTINAPLALNAKSRFQGSPNIILKNTTLSMSGETGMELDDFSMTLDNDSYERYYTSSQVLTASANMDIKGVLSLDYRTRANQWFYIALPFDIRVGDIQTTAQYAIRYYDGANRASASVASGNWKNYTADDIIPAGRGFVYQTSQEVWSKFIAYENTNKSRAFAGKDLSTPLDANPCEVSAHKGWNLVGNPWMTWFNIHTVDFTAPITVYDQYNNRYQAYSIIDDDVALHPTQAFFVQCPEDIETITFPARGRQLTSVITDQNGARSISPRRLIDVELSNDQFSDKTRIVMNEKATLGYDYGSDASKFFADGNAVQLYTIDTNGESYAINERPTDNGVVDLAFSVPASGYYTLSLPRNQLGTVILKDLLSDTETNLSQGDYYFNSDAGTFTNRFQLTFKTQATGIEELQDETTEVVIANGGIQTTGFVQIYALDGRLVTEGEGFVGLKKGFYVVNANNKSYKIVIK